MEKTNTEERLYHQHLFRLDDETNERLLNHMEEYGFSLSGIVRRSLKMFIESEAFNNDGVEISEKQMDKK